MFVLDFLFGFFGAHVFDIPFLGYMLIHDDSVRSLRHGPCQTSLPSKQVFLKHPHMHPLLSLRALESSLQVVKR